MATASDQASSSSICTHCDRSIPSLNIDLHYVHCSRNLEKCKVCGDMIPRKQAEEHFFNTHAQVLCTLCNETMERGILDVHKGENCPLRMVTCEYCEFPLPALDLHEHQEVCGNRTEHCLMCRKYIRLNEKVVHETTCNGVPGDIAESSRNARGSVPQGRPSAPEFSPKRLLFTIAVTGIAVLLGSFFIQRKTDTNASQ